VSQQGCKNTLSAFINEANAFSLRIFTNGCLYVLKNKLAFMCYRSDGIEPSDRLLKQCSKMNEQQINRSDAYKRQTDRNSKIQKANNRPDGIEPSDRILKQCSNMNEQQINRSDAYRRQTDKNFKIQKTKPETIKFIAAIFSSIRDNTKIAGIKNCIFNMIYPLTFIAIKNPPAFYFLLFD
jgi:hypothetical protein